MEPHDYHAVEPVRASVCVLVCACVGMSECTAQRIDTFVYEKNGFSVDGVAF